MSKSYECNSCDIKSAYRGSLKTHAESMHNKDSLLLLCCNDCDVNTEELSKSEVNEAIFQNHYNEIIGIVQSKPK